MVQQIIACMRERKEFYLEEVTGLIWLFFYRWHGGIGKQRKRPNSRREIQTSRGQYSLITPAIDYISEYCDVDQVEELAAMCHQ